MKNNRFSGLLPAIIILASPALAQQGMTGEERIARVERMLAEPNPIEASESVWIEELTYMEVRDRIKAGASTAIVSTGGIEENGPFLATGKHNVILEGLCPLCLKETSIHRPAPCTFQAHSPCVMKPTRPCSRTSAIA